MDVNVKTYRCTVEVRGYELDAFGHVNNAVFLNYMEVARWRMLNDEGITLETIQTAQRWPVISSIQIKYLKPLFMGDQVEIHTQVIEHSRVRFHIEQKLYRGDVQVGHAHVESVIIDAQSRPAPIPPEYERLWK